MKKQLMSICTASCLCWWAAAQAAAQCPGTGGCFVLGGNGTPGCDDTTCCNSVCAVDSFCCTTLWDPICAGEADAICNGVPTVACFDTASLAPGTCIDIPENHCLNDGGMSLGAGSICGGCPGFGNCFLPNGSPACNEPTCCSTVCAVDPFCCNIEWDVTCANEAADMCVALPEACCFPDGSCQDLTFLDCSAVSGNPQGTGSFCDGVFCPVVCGPGNGDCFAAGGNGTLGCDDAECCATVCAVDAFCCNNTWDGICADEAAAFCTLATCATCAGDVNGDNNRDGRDIASMVNCLLDPANGPGLPPTVECVCADAGGDADVDADDLPPFVTGLLNATGPCP